MIWSVLYSNDNFNGIFHQTSAQSTIKEFCKFVNVLYPNHRTDKADPITLLNNSYHGNDHKDNWVSRDEENSSFIRYAR